MTSAVLSASSFKANPTSLGVATGGISRFQPYRPEYQSYHRLNSTYATSGNIYGKRGLSIREYRRFVRATPPGSSVEEPATKNAPPEPISLTDTALGHLCKLGKEKDLHPIVLRVGVKSGGCSGMSYVMDFVKPGEEAVDGDVIMAKADGQVEIRIDPKSLLYLFGLQLDYSDELIGGGFKFQNPNATTSCGCGTSFSV